MKRNAQRPILRYHGGKWKLAQWIIDNMPEHLIYCEPFAGAASVLMQKERARIEVLNDINNRIVSLFTVLRDPVSSQRLKELVLLTPYSETEYRICREISADPIEDARRLIVLSHQSHCPTIVSGGILSGWRRGIREHGTTSADEWASLHDEIMSWCDRLRSVFLECGTAIDVISRWDNHDTLFYVDPPYVRSTRTPGLDGYKHEMSDDDHRELAKVLNKCYGMVIISGYASDLYNEMYSGWYRVEQVSVADKGRKKTEVLWINDAACARNPQQLSLFTCCG